MQGRAPCLRPVAASRTCRLSRTEGGMVAIRVCERRQATPTDRRIQALQLNKPSHGPRNNRFLSRRRSNRMGRSSRSPLQGKIVTIFAADDPMGDCEELEGFFALALSHIT